MGLKTSVVGLSILAAACSRPSITPFTELDRDHNGRISRQEAAQDGNVAKNFARLDSNDDGELSPLEYLQVAQAQGNQWR